METARNTPRQSRDQNRRKGQGGSISVESALLLPLLMVLALAFIDFGRLLWTQTVVSSAASEAARLAVMFEPTDSAVAACAADRVQKGGIEGAPSVSVGARTASQPVKVTVSVGFDFLTLSQIDPDILGHRTVSATAVMVHQP